MDRKRLVSMVAAVAIVGGAIALVVASRHRAAAQGRAAGGAQHPGLDYATAPLDVMLTIPDAATPCETAYNAMRAGQDSAAAHGKTPLFGFLADQATFLRVCNTLPPDVQVCVAPRYSRDHREECRKKRPPGALLDQLYRSNLAGDVDDQEPPATQ